MDLMIAYHGTSPGAPLIGAQDPVSSRTLEVLWASDSYDLASQFQDGEIRKLGITLERPAIVTDEDRRIVWNGQGHARIVDAILERVASGEFDHDGVIFPETIDGMEFGDVIVVFSRIDAAGMSSVDHAVETLGLRTYDIDDWVAGPGFDQGPEVDHNESPCP